MKLKAAFATQNVGDGQVMVSIDETEDFKGLVRSNETAAFVVDCLKNDVTEEEVLDRLEETYDAPRDVLRGDLASVIDKLKSIDALED